MNNNSSNNITRLRTTNNSSNNTTTTIIREKTERDELFEAFCTESEWNDICQAYIDLFGRMPKQAETMLKNAIASGIYPWTVMDYIEATAFAPYPSPRYLMACLQNYSNTKDMEEHRKKCCIPRDFMESEKSPARSNGAEQYNRMIEYGHRKRMKYANEKSSTEEC